MNQSSFNQLSLQGFFDNVDVLILKDSDYFTSSNAPRSQEALANFSNSKKLILLSSRKENVFADQLNDRLQFRRYGLPQSQSVSRANLFNKIYDKIDKQDLFLDHSLSDGLKKYLI